MKRVFPITSTPSMEKQNAFSPGRSTRSSASIPAQPVTPGRVNHRYSKELCEKLVEALNHGESFNTIIGDKDYYGMSYAENSIRDKLNQTRLNSSSGEDSGSEAEERRKRRRRRRRKAGESFKKEDKRQQSPSPDPVTPPPRVWVDGELVDNYVSPPTSPTLIIEDTLFSTPASGLYSSSSMSIPLPSPRAAAIVRRPGTGSNNTEPMQVPECIGHVSNAYFMGPFEVREERQGEIDVLQIFLPQLPPGFTLTFSGFDDHIDFKLSRHFPITKEDVATLAKTNITVKFTGLEGQDTNNWSWSY
jgi:hypothetical protein